MLGERLFPVPVRGYGHPSSTYVPELVKVPWHIINAEHRRTITTDPPVEPDSPDQDLVTERLRSLGYV